MHYVFRVQQKDFFLEKELLFIGIIISVFADQDIFIIHDLPPVIIPCNLGSPVINKRIGGQYCLIVDQPDIAPDPRFFGIAIIYQGISEKI